VIAAGCFARRERLARDAALTVIEGYSIDSLNAANLRRRLDRSFVVQEAEHTARIEGEYLRITWRYSGYARVGGTSSFDFSIDSGKAVSFESMDCVAYDLSHDPEMERPIRPLLVGPAGISKKIAVPFLEPLEANQPFALLLTCTLPRCLSAGKGYYTSTLSFVQKRVGRCTVRLLFAGHAPSWVRVYDCAPPGVPSLVKSLVPVRRKPGLAEYTDVMEDLPGRSARVYLFWRDSLQKPPTLRLDRVGGSRPPVVQ
jgi:hypothetical protein